MNRLFYFFIPFLVLCAYQVGMGQDEDLPLPQERLSGAPEVPPQIAPLPRVEVPELPEVVKTAPTKTPSKSNALPSSTSSSGQFIVYGPDLRIRSGIAGKCEEISSELGGLLRTTDQWVRTIVVQIKPLSPGDPKDLGITTQVSALTHGGFHLQLNVPERSGLRPVDFRRELIRLLLTERILRSHKSLPNDNGSDLVPLWVHTGVVKALDYRLRGRPSAEFAAIFKSGKVYGIEEILDVAATGLDGLSRTIYETSCCALVMAVLDQPDGPLRFSRYLAALVQEGKSQRELLKQWFPSLAESDASLNKWWSLQLATLAAPSMAETLDPTETAEMLDRALTFGVPITAEYKLPSPQKIQSLASQRPAPLKVPNVVSGTDGSEKTGGGSSGSTAKKNSGSVASKPSSKSVSRRPSELPAAPLVEEEQTEEEKEKKGFLRNFIPFLPKDSKQKETVTEGTEAESPSPKAKDDEKTSKLEEAAAKERDKEQKKAQEVAAKEKAAIERAERERIEKEKEALEKEEKERAKKAATEEKSADGKRPKATGSEVPEKEVKDKPSEAPPAGEKNRSLNPLKWFRGNKDSTDKKEGSEEKEVSVRLFNPEALFVSNECSERNAPSNRGFSYGQGRFIQASVGKPLESVAMAESVLFPIEDFAVVLEHPDKDRILSQMRTALQEVAIRGNVLFRDIANEYIKVIGEISDGKTKGVSERLKELRNRALSTYVKACAVQDYLDWYEATQSTRYSGLFEDFLNLPVRVKEELPARNDPISNYLNEVESLLNR